MLESRFLITSMEDCQFIQAWSAYGSWQKRCHFDKIVIMKIAYFNCFSGISGDMCLGALVDLGLPLADLSKALEGLRLVGFSLKSRRVKRAGLSATKVDVLVQDGMDRPMTFQDIRRLLQAARLPAVVREDSLRVFENLAKAEAAAH